MNNKEIHKHLTVLLDASANIHDAEGALLWLDSVAPLLRFSEEYYGQFARPLQVLQTAGFSQSAKDSAWKKCVSIVRQATYSLEIDGTSDKPLAELMPAQVMLQPATPLLPPERVTLSWLWNHASWSVWVWFSGALTGTFLLGISLGQSQWYDQITTRKTPTVATPKSTEKTIAPASTSDSKKIDSPVKSAP